MFLDWLTFFGKFKLLILLAVIYLAPIVYSLFDMRRYVILVCVLAVLAAFMSMPYVAALTLILTLGLGTPVVASSAVLIYVLCFLPFAYAWSGGWAARIAGAVISIAAAGAVAFVPVWMGRQQAERAAAPLVATDIRPESPVVVRSVEIRRQSNVGRPCGFECRTLLLTRQVDWVRVVDWSLDRRGGYEIDSSNYYELKEGPSCSVHGSNGDEADAYCVLPAEDAGAPAELVVSFEVKPAKDILVVDENDDEDRDASATMALYAWNMWRRAAAHLRRDDERSLIFQQTEIEMDVALFPTLIAPEISGGLGAGTLKSGGLMLHKSKRRINPVSLSQTLAALGFDLTEVPGSAPSRPQSWRDPSTPEMTLEVIAILNLPGSQPFNRAQIKVIHRWMAHTHPNDNWSPELTALIQRIARDERLKGSGALRKFFARNSAVAEALLPDLIDHLETYGTTKRDHPLHSLIWNLVSVEPALLAPYADRLIALLEADDWSLQLGIRRAIGRIGVDPRPYITPISDDLLSGRESFPRVYAACVAEERWRPLLIPELRAGLAASHAKERLLNEYHERILEALAHFGDQDFVARELASGRYPDAERIERAIRRASKQPEHARTYLCRR